VTLCVTARSDAPDGLSRKVHPVGDSQARPLAIRVTAGQAGDAPAVEAVMARIRISRIGLGRPRTHPVVVLVDRAHSSRAIRGHLRRRASGRYPSGRRSDRPPSAV